MRPAKEIRFSRIVYSFQFPEIRKATFRANQPFQVNRSIGSIQKVKETNFTLNQTLKTMKNLRAYFSAILILLMFTMSGCELIGDIFKAGMWTAVILIVIVVLIIMWILRAIRGRGPRV